MEFNNKNLGFNKKCAFQQQNVALNQQKIVDSTVEMLEFSHQKMADFKRRGFQATKTVHWTKTGNFGVYQHFQTNPNVIFAKNPIENNEIPLNTHGKKKHHFPAPKSAPPRQNRESATSPVEHLVAPVICARCTTLGRLE